MLRGIRYVLPTGIQWKYLPQDLDFGAGVTCRRRLRDWKEAGVRQRLHEVLLPELNAASRLDRSLCVVDSSRVRALKTEQEGSTGPLPVDRAEPTRNQAPLELGGYAALSPQHLPIGGQGARYSVFQGRRCPAMPSPDRRPTVNLPCLFDKHH